MFVVRLSRGLPGLSSGRVEGGSRHKVPKVWVGGQIGKGKEIWHLSTCQDLLSPGLGS